MTRTNSVTLDGRPTLVEFVYGDESRGITHSSAATMLSFAVHANDTIYFCGTFAEAQMLLTKLKEVKL